ncbi:CID4 [Symbiodinium necroappetens]|uniref:CID4 protein n=1 Tax=Symbiodinium necroappetens TaxID=1628268 RepID=A0A812KC89_9DINO|nr:CID4 [Symbiodinium necroappetens]
MSARHLRNENLAPGVPSSCLHATSGSSWEQDVHGFWSRAARACELHQKLLRQDRAKSAHCACAKTESVQKALQDLEMLFVAMGRQYDDLQEVASRHRHQAARTGLATEEHAEWTDREAAHQRLSEQEATSRHLRVELAEALHQERAAQEAGLRLLADAQVHELELRELRLQLAASEHRNSQLSRSLAR